MWMYLIKKGGLPLSFAALIAAGTLLLLLPGVCNGELGVPDAFFTACSAVCLNGLLTVHTAEFTFFGQFIILILIQLGCFGILSLSAIILLFSGKGLSFDNMLIMYNLNDRFSLGGTESLLKTIAHYTFIVEALGAVLMFPGFLVQGFGFFTSLWYSIFYSVGSFCNAGIGPLPGDIAQAGRYIQSISLVLIFLGGLGIYVIYDLLQKVYDPKHRVKLHTRIVLVCCGVLIFVGTFSLYLLSLAPSGCDLPFFDAFYLSITSRTAGYSTVDLAELSPSCRTLIIILMLIGGSPGSTAGGLKTTTLAVIFAALFSSFKGDNAVIIFGRTIPLRIVLRSFTIAVIFILMAVFGGLLLSAYSPHLTDRQCFFEISSALGGTGLDAGGITPQLSLGGKLLVAFFMFTGRVGPLTIILFFVGKEKPAVLHYPEERIIVG
ncbi:MAG: potassium transporter [Lentisphaerae bacterium]|nr:potassium transporter [Lentisphaerota bacterium]